MQSTETTPAAYIASLPADRKQAMIRLRKAILTNLPNGFEECMQYGMLGYVVPLSLYKPGYHVTPGVPLPFINLASQKNHISFYHMALYEGALLDWFRDEWKAATTQKLDMGKCCVRFRKPEDIPVDLIGQLCQKMTPQQWIALYEKSISKKSK